MWQLGGDDSELTYSHLGQYQHGIITITACCESGFLSSRKRQPAHIAPRLLYEEAICFSLLLFSPLSLILLEAPTQQHSCTVLIGRTQWGLHRQAGCEDPVFIVVQGLWCAGVQAGGCVDGATSFHNTLTCKTSHMSSNINTPTEG